MLDEIEPSFRLANPAHWDIDILKSILSLDPMAGLGQGDRRIARLVEALDNFEVGSCQWGR